MDLPAGLRDGAEIHAHGTGLGLFHDEGRKRVPLDKAELVPVPIGPRSTRSTSAPACSAASAAVIPARPAPTTITSASIVAPGDTRNPPHVSITRK